MASVARYYILNKKRQEQAGNQKCQKCLQMGHWTYECKNKRKYLQRDSRTTVMKKKLKSVKNTSYNNKSVFSTGEEKSESDESSSSEDESDDSDDSSSTDSSSDSSDQSSSSSTSESSSISTSSTSSSEDSDSDDEPKRKRKKR
ncbi:zinc finger CCHC domain-containing protein 10-like [Acropora muricata]|uniref:zinc finger CCHC domain-containing protein 10-like n=1 Tax=Acropora muricata TaxID=159855 RepID=UPI0034E5A54E